VAGTLLLLRLLLLVMVVTHPTTSAMYKIPKKAWGAKSGIFPGKRFHFSFRISLGLFMNRCLLSLFNLL
jgi:hypothetical protein